MNEMPPVTEKEVVLLGLVAEEPAHAYRIEEKIKERKMDQWTNISLSSVYRVLSKLEEKNLLSCSFEHEGQGATRKVYEITAEGRSTLSRGVLEHLSWAEPVKTPFQMGLAHMTFAPHAEVLERLESRSGFLEQVEGQLAGIGEATRQAALEHGSDSALIRIDAYFAHLKCHLQAERVFLEKACQMVAEADPAWFDEEEE
jgi:DNA-binding PadR family transcriptional regulator